MTLTNKIYPLELAAITPPAMVYIRTDFRKTHTTLMTIPLSDRPNISIVRLARHCEFPHLRMRKPHFLPPICSACAFLNCVKRSPNCPSAPAPPLSCAGREKYHDNSEPRGGSAAGPCLVEAWGPLNRA